MTIQATRFGLKYRPFPTLALEYKRSQFSKAQLLVVPVPEIKTSKAPEVLQQLQLKHSELSAKVVNEAQLLSLLEKLAKQYPQAQAPPPAPVNASNDDDDDELEEEEIVSEEDMEYFSDGDSNDSFWWSIKIIHAMNTLKNLSRSAAALVVYSVFVAIKP